MNTNSKYKNFDEFFATQNENKESLKITVYGKEYEIDSELPATIFLKLYRSLKGEGNSIGEKEQMDLAMQMLGEANIVEWCDKGMSMNQLSEIINWVTEQLLSKGNSNEKGKKL